MSNLEFKAFECDVFSLANRMNEFVRIGKMVSPVLLHPLPVDKDRPGSANGVVIQALLAVQDPPRPGSKIALPGGQQLAL